MGLSLLVCEMGQLAPGGQNLAAVFLTKLLCLTCVVIHEL